MSFKQSILVPIFSLKIFWKMLHILNSKYDRLEYTPIKSDDYQFYWLAPILLQAALQHFSMNWNPSQQLDLQIITMISNSKSYRLTRSETSLSCYDRLLLSVLISNSPPLCTLRHPLTFCLSQDQLLIICGEMLNSVVQLL